MLEQAAAADKPVVLALNKVDRLKDKRQLLPALEALDASAAASRPWCPSPPPAAAGVVDLVRELLRLLPEGPPLYPEDMLTDRSERFLAGELVREQLFLRLRQELPYATAVVVDNWEERAGGDVVIDATILVERESQKAIVVGKGGQHDQATSAPPPARRSRSCSGGPRTCACT